MIKITMTFEIPEVDKPGFSSEEIVCDLQDYLQYTYGEVFGWHNNDPDIDWTEQ